MSLRIQIRREIKQALIEEGYFQEEFNNLFDEKFQRLDNERDFQETKEERQLAAAIYIESYGTIHFETL